METTQTSLEISNKAKSIYMSGDYQQAAEMFNQAKDSYLAEGDTLMAAEMQNNQSVALLRTRNPQAALDVLQGSVEVFAQAGDHRREGMALANTGSALQALKRFPEAIDLFKKSGESLELADEGELRVQVMQLLAMLYLRRFKFYEAILALQSGLAGLKNPTPRQRLMKKILFMRL